MQVKNISEKDQTSIRIASKCNKYLNLFCSKQDLDKRNKRVKKMEDKLHFVFGRKFYDAREIIEFYYLYPKMRIRLKSHEFDIKYDEIDIKSDLSLEEQEKNIDNLIMKEYIYRIIIIIVIIIVGVCIFV